MDWKKLGRKLLFPPVWLMVLLTAFSAVALTVIFVKGWEETVAAYITYVLAFYTLSVVTVFCIMVLPKQFQTIKEKIHRNPLGHRYLTDRPFRLQVALYLSLGFSLLYVLTNLLTWYWARSWWFVVLAVYYVIMAVMRFLLAGYVRTHQMGGDVLQEWKRTRVCAYVLLLVNLSLSGAVLMILYQHRGYEYPGMLIYVMALYTFYALTNTIVELVRYRKTNSPVMTATTVVSLSAALVSMLNLETAMFAQFGQDMAVEDQRIFIILTGAGISVTVITMSIALITKATKAIKKR